MKTGILELNILKNKIQFNILTLNGNVTVDDFISQYETSREISLSMIDAVETDILPAKIFTSADEELIKVKGVVCTSDVYQKTVLTEHQKEMPFVLLLTQTSNKIAYDIAVINTVGNIPTFISDYKVDKNAAIAKYVLGWHKHVLDTIQESNALTVLQMVKEWCIVDDTPKKKKKVSDEEVEKELIGVDTDTVAVEIE